MACGERQGERLGRSSANYCSTYLTQPRQHDVNMGSVPPLVLRSRNSEPSSMTVRSAAKEVSYTWSKPSALSAATILPVVISPGFMPKHSPRPTRTAGAICAITVFVLSAIRSHTASTSDLTVSAPVGQTLAHCPQFTHSTSPSCLPKAGVTATSCPRCAKSIAPMPWISAHILTQSPHRTHLLGSRTSEAEDSSMG